MRLATRREWMARLAVGTVALAGGRRSRAAPPDGEAVVREAFAFIERCRRDDGGYAPSPDSAYKGNSDTRLSDLAGVTYAAVLAKTFGRELPHADRSAEYIQARQEPDGRFVHRAGEHDPKAELGVLYDTTQAVVALRALGRRPKVDPTPVVERFLARGAYRDLPWYTTSFFPLFYAALGRPFPDAYRVPLARHMEANQAEDGYLSDHVAATFHMAHFYRLVGRPTPKAGRMVARVLRDQTAEGGWDIKEPDWDVHAAFDAAFILRQLGGDGREVRAALDRAADWCLRCRNADGGFGHYPGRHSDLDAVYFQLGTLVQAGRAPGARRDIPDAQTLGWGHAMEPDKVYEPTPVVAP